MNAKESCANCSRLYKLTKSDYSKGGCEHTDMEGYICMAFADERKAVWIVGLDESLEMCECFESDELTSKTCIDCQRDCQMINLDGCIYFSQKVVPKPKPITNADRIRGMTDEELAHLLHSAEEHLFTGNLWNYDKWTEWLKQEANDAN